MNKQRITKFIMGAGTLFIASSILSSCMFFREKKEFYIPVQKVEGGAWYFINEEGERVGTQEWEFEPSITKDGIFTARIDEGLTVYRWDGDEAKAIDSLQNLVSVGVYNDGLLPVTPAMSRIRIVNRKGKVKFVLDPIDDKEITSCDQQFSEDLLVVNTSDGKAGVINSDGEVVVKPKYSEISRFNEGYALAAKYDFDNYEKGPSYYVIDKKGNAKAVKGEFGFPEGDGGDIVTQFENGVVYVLGKMDESNGYSPTTYKITTEGKATAVKDDSWVNNIEGGGTITTFYGEDNWSQVWKDAEGKQIKKIKEQGEYLSSYGKYVTLSGDKYFTVFNDKGEKLNKLDGNVSPYWSGGKFGLAYIEYANDYSDPPIYHLLNTEGQEIKGAKYFGLGTHLSISLRQYEYEGEDYYGDLTVTSAYVDVTAAASKLVSMISGEVKGKSSYYLGQSVASILSGENARFYTGSSRSFTIPTDSTYFLSNGAGFWINGTAEATQEITEATYQHYFEVDHYDVFGRAWGWNRTRQTGVHFNPNAKVMAFDLTLHTNHASGKELREAVVRRLKKDGYTTTSENANYDELTNGFRNVVIYGNKDSAGVGAIVYDKGSWWYKSDDEKAALAARLTY